MVGHVVSEVPGEMVIYLGYLSSYLSLMTVQRATLVEQSCMGYPGEPKMVGECLFFAS